MIKNFDDRFRMQRLGKIRLGVKKTSKKGNEYPSAVDYFVCPPEVKEVYGEKPRKLDIMIPHDDVESIFPTSLKRYGSQSGLICRGDGEIAHRRQEGSDNWEDISCPYKDCKYYIKGHCKEVGNLQVILPKIKGMLGIYQIDTSSYNSILNIKSSLEMLKHTVGRCSLIPLILEVKMQKANPLTDKGRMKTTVPVMFIKLDHTFYEVLDMAEERKLIKQVNVTGESELIIDNPEIDNKPDLLYNDNNNEEDPVIEGKVETIKNDKKDKFLEKKLHKFWDLLGTPSGKRKAILGKPNIDKEKLLEDLQQEVKKINNDKSKNNNQKSESDKQKLFF